MAVDDSEEELHDGGAEADVKAERAFLHPQAQATELQQETSGALT